MILTTTDDLGTQYPGCTRNYVSDPERVVLGVQGQRRRARARSGGCCPRRRPDQTDEELMNPAATEARLQRFLPKDSAYDIVHRNLYNVHQRVAASFRKGRVFLAGDAAHVNNPLGGLGLNFGIHDAIELSDLLGRVIRREAPEDDSRRIRSAPPPAQHRVRAAADRRQQEADGREGPGGARAGTSSSCAAPPPIPAAHRAYVPQGVADRERQTKRAAAPA